MNSTRQVTRIEILDHVEELFERPGAASKDDVLEQAVRSQARPQVIEELRRLPNERYSDVRDLWEQMPDVPVGI